MLKQDGAGRESSSPSPTCFSEPLTGHLSCSYLALGNICSPSATVNCSQGRDRREKVRCLKCPLSCEVCCAKQPPVQEKKPGPPTVLPRGSEQAQQFLSEFSSLCLILIWKTLIFCRARTVSGVWDSGLETRPKKPPVIFQSFSFGSLVSHCTGLRSFRGTYLCIFVLALGVFFFFFL